MRVVYSLPDAQVAEDSVVTIGAFDGIHRGHRVVLESVRRAALDRERASVVVTFFPHPSVVLGRAEPFYLTSTEEKIALLNALGIDLVVIMPFSLEMSYTRAGDYVAMLVEHLRMREVHVGYDFAFGHKREGTVAFLKRAGAERGFEVHEIPELLNGGEAISSTQIRQALRAGDVERANQWLGRPFRLSGTVAASDRQGRDTDTARIRLDIWQEHAVPANGAYACRAWLGNPAGSPPAAPRQAGPGVDSRADDAWRGESPFKAVVNVGVKPAPGHSQAHPDRPIRTVDARLLDCDRDPRGMTVALDFVARLRDEAHTSDLDARAAQMNSDADRTRELLAG